MSYYLTGLNSFTRIPLKEKGMWLLFSDLSAILMEANHAWVISDKSLIQQTTVKSWESWKRDADFDYVFIVLDCL